MTDDRQRRLQAILDKHDEAFRALREATAGVRGTDAGQGDAPAAMRLLIDALEKSSAPLRITSESQDRAIAAALEANRATIALLNDESTTGSE